MTRSDNYIKCNKKLVYPIIKNSVAYVHKFISVYLIVKFAEDWAGFNACCHPNNLLIKVFTFKCPTLFSKKITMLSKYMKEKTWTVNVYKLD